MGTIQFSEPLLKQAEDFLSVHDQTKAAQDIMQVNQILAGYNTQYAQSLDERLRREYIDITVLENFAVDCIMKLDT